MGTLLRQLSEHILFFASRLSPGEPTKVPRHERLAAPPGVFACRWPPKKPNDAPLLQPSHSRSGLDCRPFIYCVIGCCIDIFCLKPYDLILRRVFWDTSWYGLDTLILLERCRGYAAQPTGTTDMKLMSSADYASTPASGHRHEEAALPRDIDHRSTHNMAPSSARVPVNGQNGIAPQSVQDRTSAKKGR
jgi:hypothetical protein